MLAREREMTVEEEVVVLTDGNPFCIVKCQLIKEWVFRSIVKGCLRWFFVVLLF